MPKREVRSRAAYRSSFAAAADNALPDSLRWQRDPAGWARSHGIELWSKQREILEAVRDNKNTAVRSCHEIGKSFTAALATCWWLDVHPPGTARVLTTAPSDKQVKAILWHEINRLHGKMHLRGRTNLSEWYINNELVAFGRKPSDYDPTAFQGIHAQYLLIILDEACGIPKALWDAGSTLIANENGKMLVIGNPDDEFSEFAQCVKSSDWHNIRVGYRDTPNFTGEPVSQFLRDMLIHPSWVDERRRKWGEGSALFTSKCEGEFPHGTSPFTVVPVTWVERCAQLELTPDMNRVEAGVDVGGGGDRTIVRIRYGPKVGPSISFTDSDPVKTVGNIALLLREHQVTRVKVDSIGIGWGVYGALRDMSTKHNTARSTMLGALSHDAEVIPVNFGEAPTPGKETLFLNKRAEAWWNLRELSRLNLWDTAEIDADAMQELTTPLYETLDAKGKVKIQPKKDIIEQLGRSPDEADALAYAFFEVAWEGAISSAAQQMAETNLTGTVQPGDWAIGPTMHGHSAGSLLSMTSLLD